MNGISFVTESPRPGEAHRVVTPEGIAAVETIVNENRRVTMNEIVAHVDMSHGSAHQTVRDKKKLRFSFDSRSYIYIYIYIYIQYNALQNITIQVISSCPPPERPLQQHTV